MLHDRRSFLATSAAALAVPGFAMGQEKRQEKKDDKKQPDPFGGFKVGAQSYTFREFSLEQALQRMRKCDLRYGEFYQKHCPLTDNAKSIAAFVKLCGDYNVTPLAWGVQRFTKDHDANKRIFDFGKALGLKMISADPDPDSFNSLDKLCAEYKIAIGIHPHGPEGPRDKQRMHRWWSAEVILKAIKDRHALIGTCLDTGHLIRSAQLDKKLDPAEQIRTMGARNFGIHLKDHDNKTRTDVINGKGVLNVAEVLRALRAVKFDGLISIEYEANAKEPTNDVQDCVKAFQTAVTTLK